MASLVSCAACTGLMPDSSSSCPHCEVGSVASPPSRLVKVAITLIAGTAFGITLMACYGAPPACDGDCALPPDAGEDADAGADEDAGPG